MRYDRDGDQHYDVTSAFIKSIRGSDVDAALHYLARMIEAGEDPRFIARRLVIFASEDIGMADPTALLAAVAAAQAVAADRHARGPDQPGPGGHPPGAGAEVQRGDHGHRRGDGRRAGRAGRAGAARLRDAHYAGATKLGHGKGYVYPHDHPDGVVAQQYPPDELVGRDYYRPTGHGAEARIGEPAGQAARDRPAQRAERTRGDGGRRPH